MHSLSFVAWSALVVSVHLPSGCTALLLDFGWSSSSTELYETPSSGSGSDSIAWKETRSKDAAGHVCPCSRPTDVQIRRRMQTSRRYYPEFNVISGVVVHFVTSLTFDFFSGIVDLSEDHFRLYQRDNFNQYFSSFSPNSGCMLLLSIRTSFQHTVIFFRDFTLFSQGEKDISRMIADMLQNFLIILIINLL